MNSMGRKECVLKFTTIILKSFLIIYILGIVLPMIINFSLCFLLKKMQHDNSILVASMTTKNIKIISQYISVIDQFLRY